MIDINNIIETIRLRLVRAHENYSYVEGDVIDKPPYPYATIQVISGYIEEGTGAILQKHIKETDKLQITRREFPQTTLSITCISNEKNEAIKMATDTLQYLKFTGRHELKEDDIIVIEAGNIQDRSIILEDIQYEYRYGLDVRLRVVSLISVEEYYTTAVKYEFKGE